MRIREGSGTLGLGSGRDSRPFVQQLDLAVGADTNETPSRFVSYRFTGSSRGEAPDDLCPGG